MDDYDRPSIATDIAVFLSEPKSERLPETFTISALQRVQEILMGTSLLPANFRRKIADYVEETDQYTDGVGHRPARLFKKKTKKENAL